MNSNATRHFELDWLRVLAVLLLVVFHAAAIFYQGDLGTFYVTDRVKSWAIALFILFVHQWHMPLLFFVSGASTVFSLRSRTPQQYINERFQRLFIPLVFGILVLVPPQVYYHHLQITNDSISYFQFYPQFFHGIRPHGNFEWAHLWFIVYLFFFSLVTLPVLLWVERFKTTQRYDTVVRTLEQPGAIFYPALLLALIEAAFRPHWPGFQNLYDDWANVLLYLTYFIYGYFLYTEERLGQVCDRQYLFAITTALIGMSILLGVWMTDTVPTRSYSLSYLLYQAFRGFNSWCWVIALVGLARSASRWQSQMHPNLSQAWLRYNSAASYPIYLVHQSFVVAIGFYVVQLTMGILQKFLIILSGAIALSFLSYELLIRRFNLLRFCFGLKPLPAPTSTVSSVQE